MSNKVAKQIKLKEGHILLQLLSKALSFTQQHYWQSEPPRTMPRHKRKST